MRFSSLENGGKDTDIQILVDKFIILVCHILEDKSVRPWVRQRRLLQHATKCLYIVLNSLVLDDDIVWECHCLGLLYADQGKLVEAEQMILF